MGLDVAARSQVSSYAHIVAVANSGENSVSLFLCYRNATAYS